MSNAFEKYDKDKHYTYADLLEWDDDVRAEIIGGNVYMMSAPGTSHQEISGRLFFEFFSFLRGKPCRVFAAPFNVRLFPKKDLSDDTVVEPDIMVVCDSGKIDERGCNGAPDIIIEIISPSTRRRDRVIKYNLYVDAKVREYWIVYPEYKEIDVHLLDGDHYTTQAYGVNEPNTKENEMVEEIVPVTVLPGFSIDLKDIFK